MTPHENKLPECKDFQTRLERFMAESTGTNGYRERLLTLEIEVRVLKKDVLKGSIIGGIIGALIGSGAAPAVTGLINFLLRIR